MFTSSDKGRRWDGPWKLPFSETMTLQARTDYHVLGPKDLLLLMSAVKPNGDEGRPFSARTLDGGRTWNQFTWIGDQPSHIFAVFSCDSGKTWGQKSILRGNGGMGYSQSMQRNDAKVVTIYYFHDKPHSERYIVATIWEP